MSQFQCCICKRFANLIAGLCADCRHSREAYALNRGATAQAARDYAVQSDQPPTLKEYCDFLISHLS